MFDIMAYVAEVLQMDILQSVTFFEVSRIVKPLSMLVEFGLGYLNLGRPTITLSGGEAQTQDFICIVGVSDWKRD